MILKAGDLYKNVKDYDFVGFTANSTIKRDGKLTMGAGNALFCKKKYPGIDTLLGSKIEHLSEFNILTSRKYKVFALQTKINWRNSSDINLVIRSISRLNAFASAYPDLIIGCPFPGISHGGLLRSEILPYLEELPNNVHIWEYNL